MGYVPVEVETISEAKAIARQGGTYLVLDASILHQIEAAEAQGAFDGGMTGNAGGAPYSAEGASGEPSSSVTDPPPTVATSNFEGVQVISIEGLVERVLDLKDLIESFAGDALGPMILVPTEELRKWLNGGASTNDA